MDPKIVAVIVFLLVVLLWVYLSSRRQGPKSEAFGPGYFDYNGTTPMYEEAQKAWLEASKLGNAHASYADAARDAIEKARLAVLASVNADPATHTVIWTSGGSESNNLILRGMAELDNSTPHYILSETEHKTSLDCAKQLEQAGKIELTILPVLTNTFVCPYTLMNALKPNTRLVSIMHVNNESGVINNLSAYGQIIADFSKKQGQPIIFHTDAVQSMGKMPMLIQESVMAGQLHAISFSAHKFGGPLGCGGLVISRELNARLAPQISGSQNYGLRGGTDNTPGIAATGVALTISLADREHKNKQMEEKKSRITQRLQQRFPIGNFASYVGKPDTTEASSGSYGSFYKGYQIVPMGAPESSTVPNTLWFSIVREGPMAQHFCNLKLQKDLEAVGYIVSVGSACNTGKGSHVLQAIKAPYIIRCGIVRVSLGDQTSEKDCDGLVDAIVRCVDRQG